MLHNHQFCTTQWHLIHHCKVYGAPDFGGTDSKHVVLSKRSARLYCMDLKCGKSSVSVILLLLQCPVFSIMIHSVFFISFTRAQTIDVPNFDLALSGDQIDRVQHYKYFGGTVDCLDS